MKYKYQNNTWVLRKKKSELPSEVLKCGAGEG
jgi:hypothetical protein